MNDFLKNLYNDKLKYNCYCDSMNTSKNGVLFLVYLGCNDFIVINNYFGFVACGVRAYDYETKKLNISYKIYNNKVSNSSIENLLKKHEKNFKTNTEIIINYIES